MSDEHSHLTDFPEELGTLLARLGELRAVRGPSAGGGALEALERALREALAARERGDPPGGAREEHPGREG